MKKASVIGHFGIGYDFFDGQTVKTKNITNELRAQLGEAEVLTSDTHGGIKTLVKSPIVVLRAFCQTRNVIMLPAHNGLRVYGRLLPFYRSFFKNRKIHYVVIGGWLASFLEKREGLAKSLKKFDGIYVETSTMKKALESQGFRNVIVMPNFKKLRILTKEELVYPTDAPYKLCTFSRVTKEKGIETAVNAVKQVNDRLGYVAFSLDIYGQVDSGQTEWFENLKRRFPEYVRYCGSVDSSRSVETLQSYFALFFPTHHYTEGIPGTIIDAYAAGIPVISAKWESYSDVVNEGVTGVGYDFDDEDQLKRILVAVEKDPQMLLDMKVNCIKKAECYAPDNVIRTLINLL